MQRHWQIRWGMLGILLVVAGLTAIGGPGITSSVPAVFAQEGENQQQANGDAENGAADAGGGEKKAAGGEKKESDTPDTWLEWMIKALGWQYMLVFFALSFSLVTLLVMNLLSARRDNVCPISLVEEFEQLLEAKQYQEAYELAKADESFLGHVLSAGLGKISKGYGQAIEAMQEVGEDENMKLEHRLSYMALIGTISPMVGLFGTVHGMISSFSEIAVAGSTPSASKLAEGISTALFTTLLGLAIAIPAIAFFNILKNRVARLVLEVGILSESLMERFENLGKGKKSST